MKDKLQINTKSVVHDRAGLWSWFGIALIVIGAVVIRLSLVTMPLERDEGEYAYIAQQMLHGVPPYESAYSMKLPGIYVIYAMFLAAFGQTITAIHLGLIIFNAAAVIAVFWLTRHLFGEIAGVAAGGFYALASLIKAVTGLAANAEHFVVLPVLLGLILIVKFSGLRNLFMVFIAAILLGLAFIIKQHSIFFALFGALYLLYIDLFRRPVKWKSLVTTQLVFITGVILPFLLVCFLYWRAGLFDKFWFWTFTYAGKYAVNNTLNEAFKNISLISGHLIYSALPVWLFFLPGVLWLVINKSIRSKAPFVIGFFIFSLFCVCPGLYFRGHYFILLFPAVSVLAGAGFQFFCDWVASHSPGRHRSIIAVLAGLVSVSAVLYDQRTMLFSGDANMTSRLVYGRNPFPESVEIAKYIKQNSFPDDTVAVLGSEPQIFFYTGLRSATRYIYVYPLMETHAKAREMQMEMISEIESAKPEFIVFVCFPMSWLFKESSGTDLLLWYEQYTGKFYDIAGTAEVLSIDKTVYHWRNLPSGYKPETKLWISVYSRKKR
jgi:hypothetical protein